MIKRNYYKVVRVFPDPSSYFYIKNETMSEGRIGIWIESWLSTLNLEYSFDKVNWTPITSYFDSYVPADGYMYLRNTSGTFCTSEYNGCIVPFFKASLGGDVRTLFNYTDVDSVTAIPDYGFSHPFNTGQGSGGIRTEIVDISNISFRGITSIGARGLYQAFDNDYSKYTKGVDLRDVTTLGEGALYYMYKSPSLTEVYAPNVSTWDRNKSENWLAGVAPTGVVYKPSTLDIPTNDSSGIPSGWTTQDYPTI